MAKENKCERLRFNIEDDLYLLREVVGQNPFEDPCKWDIIRSNIVLMTSKNFSKRTLKEHVEYLIKLFSKEDWPYKKRSGTAEQYAEKVMLLQNITDLVRDFKNKPDGVKQSTKNDKFEGLMLREFATSSCSINSNQDADIYYLDAYADKSDGTLVPQMDEDSDLEILESETLPSINEQQDIINSTPKLNNSEDLIIQNSSHLHKKRKSMLQEPALNYSENVHEEEMNFKRKKIELEEKSLNLEERTLSLDEAKFEIQKKERLQQLELDYREKEAYISMMKQQQELLSLFLLENKQTLDLDLKTKKIELEEKKLNLEERKISLEEAKFEIEKMERLQQLELHAREKEAQIYIINQQQELMSLFLLDKKSS